jgi:tRNA(Ile2) C34 agmatinyltransferase TiaS
MKPGQRCRRCNRLASEAAVTHYLREATRAIYEAQRHMPEKLAGRTKWFVKKRALSLREKLSEIHGIAWVR